MGLRITLADTALFIWKSDQDIERSLLTARDYSAAGNGYLSLGLNVHSGEVDRVPEDVKAKLPGIWVAMLHLMTATR